MEFRVWPVIEVNCFEYTQICLPYQSNKTWNDRFDCDMMNQKCKKKFLSLTPRYWQFFESCFMTLIIRDWDIQLCYDKVLWLVFILWSIDFSDVYLATVQPQPQYVVIVMDDGNSLSSNQLKTAKGIAKQFLNSLSGRDRVSWRQNWDNDKKLGQMENFRISVVVRSVFDFVTLYIISQYDYFLVKGKIRKFCLAL